MRRIPILSPGGWPAILAVYVSAVAAGATVAKLVPLAADLSRVFGVDAGGFGWLVSAVAIPAAALAIPSGLVVDRFGARRVLIGAGCAAAVANLLYLVAQGTALLVAARLLEGAAVVHIYTAGPALLMAMTEGRRRTAALSVWTTYMPVGTALALGCVGAVAETAWWRLAFGGHGALFLLAAGLGLLLPTETAGGPPRTLAGQLADLRTAYARPALLALAAAFFLVISVGLGANVSLPRHLSALLGLSIAQASSMVAATTLVMVPGALLTGIAIARGVPPVALFVGIAAAGVVAGAGCFLVYPGLELRSAVLAAWFLASGASTAAVMAILPVVAEPARRGAAAALLNQAAALATFVNPPLWLAFAGSPEPQAFLLLLVIGWGGAALALWVATRAGRGASSLRIDVSNDR